MSTLTRLAVAALALASAATIAPPQPAQADSSRPAYVLGHQGTRDVSLGDSAREVRAAGGRVLGRPGDVCRPVVLPGGPDEDGTDGYLTADRGVVAIFARPGTRTSEGIRLGSTRRALERAYPRLRDGAHGSQVRLGKHTAYVFLTRSGRVSEIGVVDDRQPCFG